MGLLTATSSVRAFETSGHFQASSEDGSIIQNAVALHQPLSKSLADVAMGSMQHRSQDHVVQGG